MLASRGVCPFARRAAAIAVEETHIKAPSCCIVDIADHPVMAFAAAVGEIVAAHRLGIFTETARKFANRIVHGGAPSGRSEEHTSELQSLMRISYAVFCLKKKTKKQASKNTQYKQTTINKK